MVPYFGRIMEHLKIYLSGQMTEEEMPLQLQALGQYSTVIVLMIFSINEIFLKFLDILAAIARTIGEQTFRPFADECLNFTVQLVQFKDDPNLRICAYGVITSLARVMKDDTAAALPVIVPLLMKAIESNESVTVATKDDNESAFPLVDLLNDDEDVSPMENEDDDESDVDGYLEEKKEACLALRELALQARYAYV
jgi:hypothetical protein